MTKPYPVYVPYKPAYDITGRTLNFLAQAGEIKSWIERSLVAVPWISKLQRETSERLAHSSTAIEGNTLSLSEVRSVARGEIVVAKARDILEIKNHLAAMRWTRSRKNKTAVTENDLLKLHALLTKTVLPKDQCGQYKTKSNRIIDHKGRTVYAPPPPQKARPLTQDLLAWLGGQDALDTHPVIVNAIAHHRLVSIHPFHDGNGRAARALGLWVLYLRQYDTPHILALDEYYETDRQLYYLKIQQARDLDDDLTYWIEYCAEGVLRVLGNTKERIERLQLHAKNSKIILTRKQEEVLRFIRDKGRVNSAEIETVFGVTRSRVNQIVKPLVDAGLVERHGQTRATTYGLA